MADENKDAVAVPRPVVVDALPAPGGHYAHAVVHGHSVYVSGQLGRGPGMTDAQAGDVRAQTRRCLENIARILHAAGSDLSRLVKVTVYVTRVEHWAAVNAEYAQVLGDHRPARAIVPAGELHHAALVEIEAIAAI